MNKTATTKSIEHSFYIATLEFNLSSGMHDEVFYRTYGVQAHSLEEAYQMFHFYWLHKCDPETFSQTSSSYALPTLFEVVDDLNGWDSPYIERNGDDVELVYLDIDDKVGLDQRASVHVKPTVVDRSTWNALNSYAGFLDIKDVVSAFFA